MSAPTAPTYPSLGASTVNRKWVLEVNTGTSGAATWTAVGGITDFKPVTDAAKWQDDTRFESGGFESQTKTSTAWSATCTVTRAPQLSDPTTYDVGQEFLRTHAIGKFGTANQVQVRFCEYDAGDPDGTASPREEAYMGYCGVGWEEQGGANDALSTVQVTLTGQGKLNIITHPYPAS